MRRAPGNDPCRSCQGGVWHRTCQISGGKDSRDRGCLHHVHFQIGAGWPIGRRASQLFGQVAQMPYAVPVVAQDGRYCGAISKTTLLKFLDRDTPVVPAV